jgi:hypothetical protein
MNKTYNQLGEEIIAVGEKGSHIRNSEEYNITMPKLIQRIGNSNAWSDIPDSSEFKDLEYICEDDNIPKSEWQNLIRSAKFYGDLK